MDKIYVIAIDVFAGYEENGVEANYETVVLTATGDWKCCLK